MRVALVVPEISAKVPLFCGCAPLGIVSLAGYLREKLVDVSIKIIDGSIGQNVTVELATFQPDIVGVSATSPQILDAYDLLDSIRVMYPNVYTVIGGIHASILPYEALEHADSVVVGDGETALVEIIRKVSCGYFPRGIIQGESIVNLDDAPNGFSFVDFNCYLNSDLGSRLKKPSVGLITSRGCPRCCPFCYNSSRPTNVRYLSAKRVVDDVTYFVEKYGVRSVFFFDDEFVVNKKRLNEIAVLFESTGLNRKISWGCLARVTSLDESTLRLMRSMGCVLIRCGFESPVPRILKYLKNGTTTVEQNANVLPLAHRFGITMGGSFIFGSPTGVNELGCEDGCGETLQEMKQALVWICSQDTLKFMDYNTMVLYPGTKVWEHVKSKGSLPSKVDYSKLRDKLLTDESCFVDKSISFKTYTAFFKELTLATWLLNQIRSSPSARTLVRLIRTETFWRISLLYPSLVVGLVRKVFDGTLREIKKHDEMLERLK